MTPLRPNEVTEAELDAPGVATMFKLVYNAVAQFSRDRTAMLLGSAFLVLMLWGPHGNLELLGAVWDGWKGPGTYGAEGRAAIIRGVPWDQEWISFWIGVLLVVGLPVLLIKRVYKQSLADYGLGFPPRDRWELTLLSGILLFLISLPAFYIGAKNAGMQAVYPFYKPFNSYGEFALYQIGYLPFFFAIEFIFRGYLLFGLFKLRDRDALPGVQGAKGPLVFGYYAILVSMLSYTAWHLGKPMPELWGTLVWGIAAGTVALATRTIWHIVLVHWALNVFLDWAILRELGKF